MSPTNTNTAQGNNALPVAERANVVAADPNGDELPIVFVIDIRRCTKAGDQIASLSGHICTNEQQEYAATEACC